MPRGYPDYNNPVYTIAARGIDLGNLQTLQIGTQSIDGLGKLFYVDNFREGLYGWERNVYGDGAAPFLHINRPFIPPVSCRLPCGTLAGGGAVDMKHQAYFRKPSGLGLEFSLSYSQTAAYVYTQLGYDGGDFLRQVILRFSTSTQVLAIYVNGVYVDIVTLDNNNDLNSFLTLKAVGNWATGYYERLLVGMEQFDLTSYPLPQTFTFSQGWYFAYFAAYGQAATQPELNIGHVILTVDEP